MCHPAAFYRIFMTFIGQTAAEILWFHDFLKWWPSAILDLFDAYFDHPLRVLGATLVVFIVVQYLVRIDAVVLIKIESINF